MSTCPDCLRPQWPGRYDKCPEGQCAAHAGLETEALSCLTLALARAREERDLWQGRAVEADKERQALLVIAGHGVRADIHERVVQERDAAKAGSNALAPSGYSCALCKESITRYDYAENCCIVGEAGEIAHDLCAEERDKLAAVTERDAALAQAATLRRCLGFFASVIKSGEPWTETCEREYRAALAGTPDNVVAVTLPEGDTREGEWPLRDGDLVTFARRGDGKPDITFYAGAFAGDGWTTTDLAEARALAAALLAAAAQAERGGAA